MKEITNYMSSYFLYPILEKYQGRKIISKLRKLEELDKVTAFERDEIYKNRLYDILLEASKFVPYYRDLFKEIDFEPESILEDVENIKKIPFLTKDIIKREGSRLHNERISNSKTHLRKTGGSTGESTLIYYSDEALDWTAASNLLALSWAGKKRHYNEAHFSSAFPEEFPLRDRIKEYIKCRALNRINIETSSFDNHNMKKVFNKLAKAKVYYLEGHPSTAYALALYVKEHEQVNQPLFQVFESTGEVLDENKRNTIEKYLGCKVYNRYGSAEFGVIAHELNNESKRLKVLTSMVYPEVISGDCLNELVLTSTTNNYMPLIRYKTGDLTESLEVTDSGYFLKGIQGRVHDVVRIGNETYPTHYIQDLLDRLGHVIDFQVENLVNGVLKLYLVVPNESVQDSIRERLNTWMKNDVVVEFIELRQLKRVGARSKFRYVISSQDS